MPEENSNQPNPNGAEPTPTENGSSQTQIDFANLNDEQLAKVYENPNLWKHPEFKKLRDAKAERDTLLKEKTEAEKQQLTEQGKFKELAEKAERERDEARTQAQQYRIDNSIEREAAKSGVVDTEAVLKLLDRGKITVDESGQIAGVAEAVKALLEEKPYLVGKGNGVTVGSPTNPGNGNTQLKRFKLSQTQDAKFYAENEKDILASMRAGLVENDLS